MLVIGWPILIIGSVYILIKGKHVYALVKDSLIGKVVRILVYIMMVVMYSLGVVSTAFMYYSEKGIYVVLPVFLIWLVTFIVTIKTLMNAEKEARSLTGANK
jgi:hypothetical protein